MAATPHYTHASWPTASRVGWRIWRCPLQLVICEWPMTRLLLGRLLLIVIVTFPSRSTGAQESSDIRQTLQQLGYVVAKSSTSETESEKPVILIESPKSVLCRVESVTVRMYADHSRSVGDPHFTCTVKLRCGTSELAQDDAEIPLRYYVLVNNEVMGFGRPSLRIGKGQPARASVGTSVELREGLRSGRAKLILIGADSKNDPWRLLVYHGFLINSLN